MSKSDAGIVAWDDVNNASLDGSLAVEATKLEMRLFEKMGVYVRVPRKHQQMHGGKIIGIRWVDVNKRDAAAPDYRSRLVGQELATYRDDVLYAATPPLEAFRMILSYAASGAGSSSRQIMINDVRRAYFMLERQETCT